MLPACTWPDTSPPRSEHSARESAPESDYRTRNRQNFSRSEVVPASSWKRRDTRCDIRKASHRVENFHPALGRDSQYISKVASRLVTRGHRESVMPGHTDKVRSGPKT